MAQRIGKYKVSTREQAIYEHDVVTANFDTMTVNGATTLNGNVTLGNAAADNITSTGNFTASNAARFDGDIKLGNAVTDKTSFFGSTLIAKGDLIISGASSIGNAASASGNTLNELMHKLSQVGIISSSLV